MECLQTDAKRFAGISLKGECSSEGAKSDSGVFD
jgi:hypothetical protein